ncbi:MAG: hypothetical protein ACXVZ1_12235 [Gaiellaceae bacterium]
MPVHREPIFVASRRLVDLAQLREEAPAFLLRVAVAMAPLLALVLVARELGSPSLGWLILIGAPIVGLAAGFTGASAREAARFGVGAALTIVALDALLLLVLLGR